MIEFLFEYESKKYPYYDVIEIDIRSFDNGLITYQVRVCSRLDSRYNKWEPVSEIKVGHLMSYIRDERLKLILSD